MSEKGLEILGRTLRCELQPRFHPLSSAKAGGDQIVISTSVLNPVRVCHAHTYTHTQVLTNSRPWVTSKWFQKVEVRLRGKSGCPSAPKYYLLGSP